MSHGRPFSYEWWLRLWMDNNNRDNESKGQHGPTSAVGSGVGEHSCDGGICVGRLMESLSNPMGRIKGVSGKHTKRHTFATHAVPRTRTNHSEDCSPAC